MSGVPFINSSRWVPFVLGMSCPLSLYLSSDRTGVLPGILGVSIFSGFILAMLDYSRECQRVRDAMEKWDVPQDEWRDDHAERHSVVRPIRVRRPEQRRKSG